MTQVLESLLEAKIVVELDPSLDRFIIQEKTESQVFRRFLFLILNDVLVDLAIPIKIKLIIKCSEDTNRFTMSFYQVTINNNKCRIPVPASVIPDIHPLELARSVLKGIYQNLNLLITKQLAEIIKKEWESSIKSKLLSEISVDQFHDFLVECVKRFLKIERAKSFFEEMREREFEEWNVKENVNEASSEWGALRLNLFFPNGKGSAYTKGGNSSSMDTEDELFDLMQDGLWYELGVMVPKVGFATDENPEENEIRIKLNDLRLVPFPIIKPGHFIVNDTVDRLALLRVSGKPAINPANGSECAVIRGDIDVEERCLEAGLTTWDSLGYIILYISTEVRNNAQIFINSRIIKYNMDQLQRAFPALVDTVLEYFNIIELTEILRELVAEKICIRDLRGILEALVNIIAFSKRPLDCDDIVNRIRISIRRNFVHKYTRSENILVVYLLDSQLESRIISNENPLRLGDEEHTQLINAIVDEYGDSLVTVQNPVILTSLEVRKPLKKLIENELPNLTVLCFHELDINMNIQPIGRIGLNR